MVPPAPRPAAGALSVFARRLGLALVTLWAAVTLSFFGLRLAAGDPLAGLLSQGLASPQQAAELRERLGLADPLLTQYARYLTGLLQGDLGRSLYTQRPVGEVIAEQAGSTVELAIAGLGMTILIGAILGLVAGSRRSTALGSGASAAAGLATALPVALTGVLILWAAMAVGRAAPAFLPLTRSDSLLLPALALGIASAGALARILEGGLQENLEAPFVLAARARGVRRGLPLIWHALRPALPLAISFLSLEAALLLGGTVVTETVFARPGLGRLLVNSILDGDFPVVQGLVLVAAAVYTLTHVAADMAAAFADPRLRDEA
ncbi:MAG TPA: ABC transporter permease [Anaerolineales bacterium]|nr:ABC transporter permease [Anaerolineales bacterium]